MGKSGAAMSAHHNGTDGLFCLDLQNFRQGISLTKKDFMIGKVA